ncbi:GNAT family N-acetyltransferase [Phenylobacterium deserti]|uniref:N-acetyltransferase n=1 Tax=Phenylobacterium deserti TaxID=1914756 RepID=A0A328AEA4_9CAUL|nr:GNAT family N-acetyltransferase [Phenylobacterium deserti]RAK52961.1 N-acetyltransferase [Phenylobacterium deserti]
MILEPQRLPILETERLRLSPLTPEDASDIFPLMDDPEVMAYWDSPEVDDPDLVAEIVASQVAQMRQGLALHWSMRALDAEGFIGCCGLTEIDRRHKRAEVGFMLSREAWGQGFALESMRTVIAYAASNGLRKLTARTHLGNRRSENLLAKLGFQKEGLLRGHVLKDGDRRDCRLFGVLL